MTTQQKFQSLGRIAWVMGKWIKLKQWARRNGFIDTAENAERWITDCKARGQRLNACQGNVGQGNGAYSSDIYSSDISAGGVK